MGSAAFDTLKAAKEFGEAGFSREQAESLAGAIGQSINERLATRDDLKQLEERLTTKIDTSVKALDTKIDSGLATLDTKIDTVEERLGGEIKLVRKDVEALDAKIDTGLAALDDKIDSTKETLEARIDGSAKTLEAQMREQTAQLGEQIANGFAEVAERQVVQMRWMVASIIGSIGVLVAAYAAFQ